MYVCVCWVVVGVGDYRVSVHLSGQFDNSYVGNMLINQM